MDHCSSDLFDRYYKSWYGIDAAYDKIAAKCGVTSNIMNILTLLYKHRVPMTQNDLKKELHLSKQTVTSILDSLEKRGLVIRTISENDKRIRMVELTPEGCVSGRHLGRIMRHIELSAFDLLTEEEQNALVNSMEKLCQSLFKILGDESEP